jgi:hypothetical protein
MRPIANRRLPLVLAVLLVTGVAPWLAPSTSEASTYQVSVDTSTLNGSAASLAFDLTDSDVGVDTTVVITSFATDGTLGSAVVTGGVSGSLPGTVTLTDLDFLNSLEQGITLGDALSFTLEMTTASSGGVPDAFSFFILTPSGSASLVGTDLAGDALLILEADGSPGGSLSAASGTEPSVPVAATPAVAVPFPAALLLLGAGTALALSRRR